MSIPKRMLDFSALLMACLILFLLFSSSLGGVY
jgi:hypothetical protein